MEKSLQMLARIIYTLHVYANQVSPGNIHTGMRRPTLVLEKLHHTLHNLV